MFKGKNLLIIQFESLEKFVINQKIDGQEITPNLNKLLKNSLYFTNYYEQVGEGTSSDADLMTNTSIYPISSGATFFSYPDTHYISLPKLFNNMGYTTTAIHPDSGSFWNWMPALKAFGFGTCIDSSRYNITETIGMGISDGTYLPQVEPIIVKQKQPFYTFLVTLSSHIPFQLPNKYKELKLSLALDNSKLGGYFQCIHYSDKQLGIFFDNLKKDGILDNTVIVIYGDHEGVHKYYAPEIRDLKPSETWWLDNHKQLPLIIYNNQLKGEEIKTIGGQIDLFPTVASLMGIDQKNYSGSVIGRNLLNTNKNFVVLRSKQFISDKPNDKEKASATQGLSIADSVIRSDYFNGR